MENKISVVVCTYDRYTLLQEALGSIELQDFPPDNFEVIIVDNSPSETAKKNFANNLEINCQHQYIMEPMPGLSRARNIGVRAAKFDIVAFMDDDARASRQWLQEISKTYVTHDDAGVVGGPVRPIWPMAKPNWLHPWLEGFLSIVDRGSDVRSLPPSEWLAGTNISFRRELIIRTGMFNENLGRIGKLLLSNEELLVTDEIRKLGFEVIYNPGAEVHHRVHEDRVSQSWMRRRAFWQTVSDMFSHPHDPGPQPEANLSKILDYLGKLPPRSRSLAGLSLDIDDPHLFNEQMEAISALARFMASDGRDFKFFLESEVK